MYLLQSILFCLLVISSVSSSKYDPSKHDDSKCEVCISFLKNFEASLDSATRGSQDLMKDALLKQCKANLKPKDERLCYYIGGLETSATGMTQDVTKPMAYSKPVQKVCADLNKKDNSICELKYEKQIDLKTVNIKKLKVKELKKVLEQNGQECKGCTEKSEFVKKVEAIAKEQGRTEL